MPVPGALPQAGMSSAFGAHGWREFFLVAKFQPKREKGSQRRDARPMPLRRRKITKEKISLSDILFRIGVGLFLFALLVALMLWLFTESAVTL